MAQKKKKVYELNYYKCSKYVCAITIKFYTFGNCSSANKLFKSKILTRNYKHAVEYLTSIFIILYIF